MKARLLMIALLLSGCGSGAFSEPGERTESVRPASPDSSPTSTTTTNTTVVSTVPPVLTKKSTPKPTTTPMPVPAPKTRYGWNPPTGPRTTSTNEDSFYGTLQTGGCSRTQSLLDEHWRSFVSPRNVVLYQAAIHLCLGQELPGRQVFERARMFGFAMMGSDTADCFVYRAVRSVLDQVAVDAVGCQVGTPPRWPTWQPDEKDDPRTDLVEGTASPTSPQPAPTS
jgi:hypothetical protein